MNTLVLCSPAKINHFLHINGQRPDGYHLIQTLFQYLDYGDEISFTPLTHSHIAVQMAFASGEDCGVPAEQNLIYKIATHLQKTYHVHSGVDIRVTKKIPMGGGLGGGSSNAATTLLALNYVWKLNLSLKTLMQIGETFGADIPCFLIGQSAWGEGIGTQLTPTILDEQYVVVLTPPCLVSTPKMYQNSQLTRNTSTLRIGTLEGLLKNGLFENAVRNDFQQLVCQNYPIVAEYMAWLNQYAKAKLSGSGASIFALVESKEKATTIIENLPPCYQAFVAKSVNRSPLHAQLINLGFFFESYWGVAKR